MERTCYHLDVGRIGSRLLNEGKQVFGPEEVADWLRQRGWTFEGDGWYCDDDARQDLRPDEITSVRRHVTEAGVTFVEPANRPKTGE